MGWNATRETRAGRTPHSRGALPVGPSFESNGQTMAASAPLVASHLPSADHERERTLAG